jgi:hypothetical protein
MSGERNADTRPSVGVLGLRSESITRRLLSWAASLDDERLLLKLASCGEGTFHYAAVAYELDRRTLTGSGDQ